MNCSNNNLALTENVNNDLRFAFFERVKTRDDVLEFEEIIKNMPTAYDECPYPLFHSFADGMYTREIHFTKGDLIVGAIHKRDYFVNVPKGRLWVVSEFGSKEIIAPASFTAKAGVKHIGYTLEDTVWIDTHKTDKTIIEEAENDIFVESYEELDRINGIVEYNEMCSDIDMSANQAYEVSRIESDIIDDRNDFIEIKDSEIEGKGIFASIDFKKGELIATGRVDNKRTQAGRYVNHADKPNAEAIMLDNKGYFFASSDIEKGAEITADYRNVRSQAIKLDRYISCQDG